VRFRDREDAGRQLARLLTKFESDNPLVLGLPRGGVPVAAEVAHALGCELDVWVVRKIGAPEQAEFALGAVAEGGVVTLDENSARWAGLTTPEIRALTQRKFAEVDERVRKFRDGRPLPKIEGRTVIVVDDGIATGRTMQAALGAIRQRRPQRLVLAVPIADVRIKPEFAELVDEIVVVQWTDHLMAIGHWYEDFEQTSDDEVISLLERSRARQAGEVRAGADPNPSREIDIDVEDVTLTGTLSIPPGAAGLVIFAHGSGSSRFSPRNRFVATRLRSQGMGTLLFDLLTPLEELEDAQTAELRFDIGFLATRLGQVTLAIAAEPDVRGLKLGYFGASTGAAAALVAAAQQPELITAIVSRGGRPDLAEGALPQVRAPTLLLVGERDLEVLELNLKALEDLRCEKELAVISGATHLFEESGTLEQVAERAADWFERHFVPRLYEVPAPGA